MRRFAKLAGAAAAIALAIVAVATIPPLARPLDRVFLDLQQRAAAQSPAPDEKSKTQKAVETQPLSQRPAEPALYEGPFAFVGELRETKDRDDIHAKRAEIRKRAIELQAEEQRLRDSFELLRSRQKDAETALQGIGLSDSERAKHQAELDAIKQSIEELRQDARDVDNRTKELRPLYQETEEIESVVIKPQHGLRAKSIANISQRLGASSATVLADDATNSLVIKGSRWRIGELRQIIAAFEEHLSPPSDGPSAQVSKAVSPTIHIVWPKHASAQNLLGLVQGLFAHRANFAAEADSNALVVETYQGTPEEIVKLVEQLDAPARSVPPSPSPVAGRSKYERSGAYGPALRGPSDSTVPSSTKYMALTILSLKNPAEVVKAVKDAFGDRVQVEAVGERVRITYEQRLALEIGKLLGRIDARDASESPAKHVYEELGPTWTPGTRTVGPSVSYATGTGETLKWRTDIEAAKREASANDKLLLYQFYAEWCLPCTRLDQVVFSQPNMGRALEADYVPVKVRYDQDQATKNLGDGYGVAHLPWTVVASPDGEKVLGFDSPRDADSYLSKVTEIAQNFRDGPPEVDPTPADLLEFAPSSEWRLQVIPLKHANALLLAIVLRDLHRDLNWESLRIKAKPASNRLLISTSLRHPVAKDQVQESLERLDVPARPGWVGADAVADALARSEKLSMTIVDQLKAMAASKAQTGQRGTLLEAKLTEELHRILAIRQALRRQELAIIRNRLVELEKTLDERDKVMNEIVKKRMSDLLSGNGKLQWNPPPIPAASSPVPRGVAPPPPTPPTTSAAPAERYSYSFLVSSVPPNSLAPPNWGRREINGRPYYIVPLSPPSADSSGIEPAIAPNEPAAPSTAGRDTGGRTAGNDPQQALLELDLKEAQLQWEAEQRLFEDAQRLAKRNFFSPREVKAAETKLKMAEIQVQRAQARLDLHVDQREGGNNSTPSLSSAGVATNANADEAALRLDLKEAQIRAAGAKENHESISTLAKAGQANQLELIDVRTKAELAELQLERAQRRLDDHLKRKTSSGTPASPTPTVGVSGHERAPTQAEREAEEALLELDAREAEARASVAGAEYKSMEESIKKTPGSFTQTQRMAVWQKWKLAELQVERAKIKLDLYRKQKAARDKSSQPAPDAKDRLPAAKDEQTGDPAADEALLQLDVQQAEALLAGTTDAYRSLKVKLDSGASDVTNQQVIEAKTKADLARLQLERAKVNLELQKKRTKSEPDRNSAAAVRDLEASLLKLGVQEAEAALAGAESIYKSLKNLQDIGATGGSAAEVAGAKTKLDLAKLQLQRAKLQLEAFLKDAPTPTPASPASPTKAPDAAPLPNAPSSEKEKDRAPAAANGSDEQSRQVNTSERNRLLGDWRVIEARESNGRSLPLSVLEEYAIRFTEERCWYESPGASKPEEFTYELNASQSPPHLDLRLTTARGDLAEFLKEHVGGIA